MSDEAKKSGSESGSADGAERASGELRYPVAGLEYGWDLGRGSMTLGGFAVTTFFRDSSLASLISGFEAMVGTARFALAQQAEGQRGIAGDWAVISQHPTFEQGFAAISEFAGAAGWGRWRLVSIDRDKREMRIVVENSWEAQMQRALGVCWGSGLTAGKFSAFGQKVFGVNCWSDQTRFAARGDQVDEFVIGPSDRSIERELAAMTETDEATRADLASALRELKELSAQRERAFEERNRMVDELREKLDVIERQQDAIRAMSTPIIQVWDGVVVVPVVGVVDAERTANIMERLLEEVVRTKSRVAILDLTGVETIDTGTADNFLKVLGGAQLMGARGIIVGINPQVAQTVVALGVNLSGIAIYANLKEALKASIQGALGKR